MFSCFDVSSLTLLVRNRACLPRGYSSFVVVSVTLLSFCYFFPPLRFPSWLLLLLLLRVRARTTEVKVLLAYDEDTEEEAEEGDQDAAAKKEQ